MLKSFVVAGATALAIGAASLAHAQPGPRAHHAPRITAEDAAALTEARLAGLQAGLRLTAEQQKHWPAVETTIRDLTKQRADRREARAERRKARAAERKETQAGNEQTRTERREARRAEREQRRSAIERLRRGANVMNARAAAINGHAAALTRLADAAEPLYRSLDDDQKRRFGILMRAGLELERGEARRHWRGGHGGWR